MKLSDMTDERLKVLLAYTFGFFLLFAYFVLALVTSIMHIKEDTSYGLKEILAALGPLGGLFCGWAFRQAQ